MIEKIEKLFLNLPPLRLILTILLFIFLGAFLIYFGFEYKQEWLKTIGITFISVTLIKFFLSMDAFLNTVKDVLKDILFFDEKFLENLSYKEKEKVYKMVKKLFENERENRAIELAKKIYDSSKIDKNFYVQESTRTYTILANGNVISSYRFKVEIMKDGDMEFDFIYKVDNEDVKMPNFNDFLNKDRFSDFSFSKKLLKYVSKDDGAGERELNYSVLKDEPKVKELKFCINGTQKGDIITFMFSITCKGEYSEELINEIKQGKKGPSSESRSLHGIRHIIYQFETYHGDNNVIRLTPYLKINEKIRNADKIEEDIYYKRYFWTIYLDENSNNIIKLSLG